MTKEKYDGYVDSINFKPLADRVLVKVKSSPTKTAGGIFLPENSRDKPQTAVVVAVGEGRLLENGTISPMNVKVGQTVYFTQWSGAEIEFNLEKYLVMKESDLLGFDDPSSN